MVLLKIPTSQSHDEHSPSSNNSRFGGAPKFPNRCGDVHTEPMSLIGSICDDVNVVHPIKIAGTRAAPRKYPRPKIRKEFSVKRAFGKPNRYFVRGKSILGNGNSVRNFESVATDITWSNGDEDISVPLLTGDRECGVVASEQCVDSRDKVNNALKSFRDVLTEQEKKVVKLGVRRSSFLISVAINLRRQQKWVNTTKQIGNVPGVEIGDKFRYRAELNVIGLHCQFFDGIDYTEKNGTRLASSIVAAGRYDDTYSSDFLVYSGHGGNPVLSRQKQPTHQKLIRGNLALKNSWGARTPVRVIRSLKFSKVSTSRGIHHERSLNANYVYDGLYVVEKYWQERGQFGKLVVKFLLKRIPDQAKLTWGEVDRKKGKKSRSFSPTTSVVSPELHSFSTPTSCDCADGCSDSEDCSCKAINGGKIPYDYNECAVEAKPFIYECGFSCKCFSSCLNRVCQRGSQLQLEIFRNKLKGWGVRSRSYVPCGSFVCEYKGEVLPDKPFLPYRPSIFNEVDEDLTINVAKVENVGRLINHSCSPNLYVQLVLFDHDGQRLPHIMFFAMKDIPPLQELTYNYN